MVGGSHVNVGGTGPAEEGAGVVQGILVQLCGSQRREREHQEKGENLTRCWKQRGHARIRHTS